MSFTPSRNILTVLSDCSHKGCQLLFKGMGFGGGCQICCPSIQYLGKERGRRQKGETASMKEREGEEGTVGELKGVAEVSGNSKTHRQDPLHDILTEVYPPKSKMVSAAR